jgi:hypothetical protein
MDSLRHGAAHTTTRRALRERKGEEEKKKGLTQSLEKGFSTLFFFFFIFDGKDERFFGGRNIDADCVLQVLQGGSGR